ncbi:MAG: transcription termination/antitermination protein NusA, partial [Bacteroidia bacterium]|nr:transcription termination/antitermination protein NusA [Bacteroidia bacterium]
VELTEFADEIDINIINKLKEKGFDTARQVLSKPNDYLEKITQLDSDTIQKIKDILQKEFEE